MLAVCRSGSWCPRPVRDLKVQAYAILSDISSSEDLSREMEQLVARQAHNLEAEGSIPSLATNAYANQTL